MNRSKQLLEGEEDIYRYGVQDNLMGDLERELDSPEDRWVKGAVSVGPEVFWKVIFSVFSDEEIDSLLNMRESFRATSILEDDDGDILWRDREQVPRRRTNPKAGRHTGTPSSSSHQKRHSARRHIKKAMDHGRKYADPNDFKGVMEEGMKYLAKQIVQVSEYRDKFTKGLQGEEDRGLEDDN